MFLGDLPVVCFDDSFNVVGAAVTNFHIVFVEKFVPSVVVGEMFNNEIEEGLSNVRSDRFIPGGIVPENFSRSIPTLGL